MLYFFKYNVTLHFNDSSSIFAYKIIKQSFLFKSFNSPIKVLENFLLPSILLVFIHDAPSMLQPCSVTESNRVHDEIEVALSTVKGLKGNPVQVLIAIFETKSIPVHRQNRLYRLSDIKHPDVIN